MQCRSIAGQLVLLELAIAQLQLPDGSAAVHRRLNYITKKCILAADRCRAIWEPLDDCDVNGDLEETRGGHSKVGPGGIRVSERLKLFQE